MKGLFLTAALGEVCVSSFAQGTLNFANAGVGFEARVYDTDGVTALTGSTWEADLFWAPGVVTDSTLLTGLNEPTTFSTVPIQAGLFFGGTRTIPGAAAGITAQIRVWILLTAAPGPPLPQAQVPLPESVNRSYSR